MNNITTDDYEYMLHFWGGAFQGTITPEDLSKLGVDNQDGYAWFKTKEDRDKFKKALYKLAGSSGIAIKEEEGEKTRYRTVSYIDFVFDGKTYSIEYDFG